MSKTSIVAKEYRLQQWTMQIKECQARPEHMTVQEWCAQNHLTKANYYYHLRRVREAFLESSKQDIIPLPIAPSQPLISKLKLSIGDIFIHIEQGASSDFLKEIIEVVQNAQ